MKLLPPKLRSRKRLVAALTALVVVAGTGIANAVASTPSVGLLVSTTATHASPKRLTHSSLDGVAYIFVGNPPSTPITSVSFYLDDPSGNGTPYATVTTAPFDMAANGLDLTTLPEGMHTVLAVLQVNNAARDLYARFFVHHAATTTPTVPLPLTPAPTVPTGATAVPTVPPAASTVGVPANLRAFTGGDSTAVLWDVDANPANVANYEVYRDGALVASPKKTKESSVLLFNGTRYYDKDITAGTTYKYTVVAVGTDGTKSAATAPLSVTVPTDTTPVPDVTWDGDLPADLAWLEGASVETIQTWYPKVADVLARPDYEVPTAITVHLGDLSAMNALASANAADNIITIDEVKLRADPDKVYGTLVHEATHIVQNNPTSDGNYFIVEGTAEWARRYMFDDRSNWPAASNDFRWGYITGAYFMDWLNKTYNMPTAIHEANIAEHNGNYSDAIFTDKAGGKTLDTLWAECQKTIPPGGL